MSAKFAVGSPRSRGARRSAAFPALIFAALIFSACATSANMSGTGNSPSLLSGLGLGTDSPAAETAAEMEPTLKTAGFETVRPATPEQDERLKSLPPLQLSYYQDNKGIPNYWMADPDGCHCLFHGDEAAYQRYEDLNLDNKIAEHDKQRMEAEQYQHQMPPPGFGGPGFGGPFEPGFGGSGFGFGFGGGGFGFSL